MGEIAENEQDALIKFKENLMDLDLQNNILLSDMHLIRWLRAREMDIEKANEMLRNNLNWREENDIVNCVKRSVPESVASEYPFEYIGYDLQGNVVVVIPYGKMDLKKALKETGKLACINMRNYYCENTFQKALERSDGKVMKRMSVIIDFNGLSYMQFANVDVLEFILSSIQAFEQNYPEILGTAFIVNAPAVWSILWAMTKPLMHQKTIEKVVITGSDPKKITAILENYISKDNFPTKYGGNAILKYPEPVILSNNNSNDDQNESESKSSTIPNPTNKSFFGSVFRSWTN